MIGGLLAGSSAYAQVSDAWTRPVGAVMATGPNSYAPPPADQFGTAGGDRATAVGVDAIALNSGSSAFAYKAAPYGFGGTAPGFQKEASGAYAAVGLTSTAAAAAAGANSVAVGVMSTATGANAAALGNKTPASGDSSTALGDGASANQAQSAAMGASAAASATGATAVGSGEQAETAVGAGAHADGANSAAFGYNAAATGANSVAAGNDAKAEGVNSTAVGTESIASDNAVGVGPRAVADGASSVAIGDTASASGSEAASVGANAAATGSGSIAFGTAAKASGVNSSAIGASSEASGDQATAVGSSSNAAGVGSFAAGNFASATGENAVAVGEKSSAVGENAVAVGSQATANADDSVALGSNSSATHANSVALGAGSATTIGAQSGYTAFGLSAPQASTGEVNVGGRTITGVAPGAADTDAVNVEQLKAVSDQAQAALAASDESNVKYDRNGNPSLQAPGNDSVNKQSITLAGDGGTTIHNVAAGTDTSDAVNLGQLNDAINNVNNSISQIINVPVTTTDPLFSADGSRNTEAASATGTHAVAVGANATASGIGAVAIGAGAQASANNSVALGQNSVADRENSVSVGAAGSERQITNVAAGTQGTDAVNLNQLNQSSSGMLKSANDYTDSKTEGTRRDAYAGTASALAVAGLPQAVLPGHGMVAIGGGTYGGQSAIALGVSQLSDNGVWAYKVTGTTSTRGNFGVSLGAGMHW
jgi:trimeric autotransporter adhesin